MTAELDKFLAQVATPLKRKASADNDAWEWVKNKRGKVTRNAELGRYRVFEDEDAHKTRVSFLTQNKAFALPILATGRDAEGAYFVDTKDLTAEGYQVLDRVKRRLSKPQKQSLWGELERVLQQLPHSYKDLTNLNNYLVKFDSDDRASVVLVEGGEPEQGHYDYRTLLSRLALPKPPKKPSWLI